MYIVRIVPMYNSTISMSTEYDIAINELEQTGLFRSSNNFVENSLSITFFVASVTL